MDELDKWDRTYIRQQLVGFGHLLNRAATEAKSQYDLIASLTKKVETLEAGRVEDAAKIGELSAKVDTMAKWIKENVVVKKDKSAA